MRAEPPIEPSRLEAIIEFVQAAEQLKDTLRSGRTAKGRAESTAEHSWRLCLLVMMFERELAAFDLARLLKLCIIHDLGEAISGDTPAVVQNKDPDRAARERIDLLSLCAPLPQDLRDEVMGLWDDYAAGASPEAALAKGFDKVETMLQHLVGLNAADFDYQFNLTYGVRQTAKHELLRQLRASVDSRTLVRLRSRGPAG